MNRILIGALAALLLVAAGVFWWQGRAADQPAPAFSPPPPQIVPEGEPPEADASEMVGPDLPQASEQSREQRRFDKLDKDRDNRITRTEMLAPRVKDFRKLDVDGNNLLTFEEWAIATSDKFKGADANADGWLGREEYRTTRMKAKKSACACR